MAKSTQPGHIIICDASAFRALCCERRRYQSLGWTPLSSREIQLAVSRSSANADCIDYDLLEQLGVWSPGEKLHLLVNNQGKRRYTDPISMHVSSKPLPMGSLCNIAPGIDVFSPAMIAAQYANCHSFGEGYAFFEELCSEITFAEPGYKDWLADSDSEDISNEGPIAASSTSISIPKMRYFKCNAALAPSELNNWIKRINWCPGHIQARSIAPYVLGDARSPMEIMMFGMLCLPMSRGGFACEGGISNYRINFNEEATAVSSMPYAIGDLVFPASNEILEYKGHPHDSKASRIRDEKREAGLSAMGFRVTAINNEQIKDAAALEAIAKRLYRQAGLRFRYYIDAYRTRQYQLMRELTTWMQGQSE